MTIKDPDAQMEAELAALEAKGIDPYADREAKDEADDEVDAEVLESEAADVEAEADDAADPAKEVEQDEPVAKVVPAETERDDQPSYKAQMPQDYKAQRTALTAAKAQAMSDLLNGVIDAEAFAALDATISDQLEDLTAIRIRTETLHEANTQNESARQGREIQALISRTKGEVDYATDQQAARQFDTAMQLIGADPGNAGMAFGELINLSHKMVISLRGIMPPKTAKATPTPKAAPDRTPPAPPVTLSGLPTAATSGSQSVSQAVGKLSGDDLERAFDALSDAELKKLMRA